MSVAEILLPLFVQVLLTFVLLFLMASQRVGDLRSGAVRARDISLGQPNWRPYTMQVSNAFRNQFELPVLFYVLIIIAIYIRRADYFLVLLAWIFVAIRVVHAVIHITSNKVQIRGPVWLLSAVILAIMWGLLMVNVLAVR